MSSQSFPFIVSKGPRLQDDPKVRKLIRKQAMKEIGQARRKKRSKPSTPGSSDSGVECNSTEASSSSYSPMDAEYDELLVRSDWPASTTSLSPTPHLSSDYELVRTRFRVDITDLSMLTDFHVGKGSHKIIAASTANLESLLSARQWSYMQYIPSRYEASECLRAATDCVLAKVGSLVAPQEFNNEELSLRLYSKALTSLQDAISNEAHYLDADVLCATELLGLHELLDISRNVAYDHHIHGSARLVRHWSPQRFQTEFEKALFAGHIGPIVSAALNDNTHCYLAQPQWMALYRAIAVDTDYLTDRSPLTVGIRSTWFIIPGLWHDVDETVTSETLFDDTVVEELAGRCRRAMRDVLSWTEDYKNHCVRHSLRSPPPEELAKRRELFGNSLECLVFLKRLLATVADGERLQLELETQALSHLLLELQEQPSPKHSWLFSGHEVGIAYTVQFTKAEWEDEREYESDFDRKMACRSRYVNWSDMIRMRH